MKLKKSIRILFLIFTLAPLYIFGIFMMYENSRNIESIMRENLRVISGTQIFDIKRSCDAQKENLEVIADFDIVREAVKASLAGNHKDPGQGRRYLMNMLAERAAYNPDIISISVIDRDYNVVVSSLPYDKEEKSMLAYSSDRLLREEFYISNVFTRENNGEMMEAVVACQSIMEDGEIIGYVVEEIAPTYFDKNRTETNLWENGTLYLLDGANNIITAGSSEENKRSQFVTGKEERKDFAKAWNEADMQKNPSGQLSYQMLGQEYITYYSTISYTDWRILVTINLTPYTESRRVYRVLLFLTIGIVSALLLVVNKYMTRRLLKPIESISATLKNIQKEQDYSHRVPCNRADEIGTLSFEINTLLEYIEKENIQEREQKRYLARQAERDPLTDVKNKNAAEEQMREMLKETVQSGKKVAIGFVDIDDFKDYNTKYGHLEGDNVIRFVADVLKKSIDGVVGRYGGDEFIFAIRNITDKQSVEEELKRILKELNLGMKNPEGGENLSVSASIGVVIASGANLSYTYLIGCADEMMYQVKKRGKNTYMIKEE